MQPVRFFYWLQTLNISPKVVHLPSKGRFI